MWGLIWALAGTILAEVGAGGYSIDTTSTPSVGLFGIGSCGAVRGRGANRQVRLADIWQSRRSQLRGVSGSRRCMTLHSAMALFTLPSSPRTLSIRMIILTTPRSLQPINLMPEHGVSTQASCIASP
ncbi:hypothetical protein BD779DRAFT_780822 [Infundibulicybe gibba]|nr:hypothetical protein BD779DRAFT_780822 [Infundibulicybe gibba]